MRSFSSSIFFFFNDTATTEIYTLSLHDALPISPPAAGRLQAVQLQREDRPRADDAGAGPPPGDPRLLRAHDLVPAQPRSEEHTSELQSQSNLVCRLLLEKKKK